MLDKLNNFQKSFYYFFAITFLIYLHYKTAVHLINFVKTSLFCSSLLKSLISKTFCEDFSFV